MQYFVKAAHFRGLVVVLLSGLEGEGDLRVAVEGLLGGYLNVQFGHIILLRKRNSHIIVLVLAVTLDFSLHQFLHGFQIDPLVKVFLSLDLQAFSLEVFQHD